ncbi:PAS domain-containing sensor histidine kinase [Rhodopila globiformis]|uniref:PAS domain-containing sensor histidine kinase n=1 Tax=Rhodopila globiformis TaxID=1071 RepID=UPI0013049DED|nr:PAS domain-containing sensor histidine kinase [Rhodopila globiformis]
MKSLTARLLRAAGSALLAAARRLQADATGPPPGLAHGWAEPGNPATAPDPATAKAREHAMRIALESTGDSVLVLSADERIVYLNRRARAQIADGRNLIGVPFWTTFPDIVGGAFWTALQRCKADRQPNSAEGFYAPLGRHFEGRLFPAEDGSVTVFFRDVTEQRRSERTLAESESRFRAAVQALNGILWTNSAAGAMDGEQPGWAALTGQIRDEYQGFGWAQAVHPEDRQPTIDAWNAAVAARRPFVFEHRVRRHDGVWRHFTIRAVPVLQPDGAIHEWVGVHTDVTEQREAEAALARSEQRLRLATESAGIGTWELELATGRAVRSPGHAAIFGDDLPDDAWSNATFLSHVLPEDRARLDQIRRDALKTFSGWQFECRIRRARDGAVRWIEARGAPVRDADGTVARYVGIVIDVTGRKEIQAAQARSAEILEQRVAERTRELARQIAEREKAEAALMQAQRLEAVGQLTGGVAHDFNNLLTAVIGNLDLLARRLPDDRLRRYVDVAMAAARRGGELTQQLLAFARKQNVRPRPVDVNAVAVAMRSLLGRSLGGLVTIETDLAAGAWPALSDPAQLEAILLNLAINARDAMPTGGRLRIATRNVDAGSPGLPPGLDPGDYVVVAVQDTGSGMPPEVAAKAFEPFFTTKEIGAGSGLGLSQVLGIASQFGGTARLDSRVGEGTTVEVFLPRSAAAARSPGLDAVPAAATDAPAAPGAAILVVDDEDAVREVNAAMLQDDGYVVRQAGSRAAALVAIQDGRFDLALVDYAMPDMRGTEFVRQARRRQPGLRVVYVTGNAEPLVADMGDRRDPVLAKPYSPAVLLAAVRDALADRHAGEGAE